MVLVHCRIDWCLYAGGGFNIISRSGDNGFVTELSSISNLTLEITIECIQCKLLDSANLEI